MMRRPVAALLATLALAPATSFAQHHAARGGAISKARTAVPKAPATMVVPAAIPKSNDWPRSEALPPNPPIGDLARDSASGLGPQALTTLGSFGGALLIMLVGWWRIRRAVTLDNQYQPPAWDTY